MAEKIIKADRKVDCFVSSYLKKKSIKSCMNTNDDGGRNKENDNSHPAFQRFAVL